MAQARDGGALVPAVSAVVARETKRLTVGWQIISPFTRHPVQAAMDARVVEEAAGPPRGPHGFGTSEIFLNNTKQYIRTGRSARMRDAVTIVPRRRSRVRSFEDDGATWSAYVPAAAPAGS